MVCFSKAPQRPAGPTEPGGQGRRAGKGTRNFDDFWGRKPIGNTRLAELSNLMRSGAEKSNFGFTSGREPGPRAARRHGDFWG